MKIGHVENQRAGFISDLGIVRAGLTDFEDGLSSINFQCFEPKIGEIEIRERDVNMEGFRS